MTVIISELSDARKEQARSTGVADHVVDPSSENLIDRAVKIIVHP
ncbi:hypothetical protein [Leifsonia kafniensis]